MYQCLRSKRLGSAGGRWAGDSLREGRRRGSRSLRHRELQVRRGRASAQSISPHKLQLANRKHVKSTHSRKDCAQLLATAVLLWSKVRDCWFSIDLRTRPSGSHAHCYAPTLSLPAFTEPTIQIFQTSPVPGASTIARSSATLPFSRIPTGVSLILLCKSLPLNPQVIAVSFARERQIASPGSTGWPKLAFSPQSPTLRERALLSKA